MDEHQQDGPLGCAGECQRCLHRFTSDIFRWRGRVLCGNCRYYERNLRWPDAVPSKRLPDAVMRSEDDISATHTHGRWRQTEVVSEKHANLLIEIENEHGD